MKVVRYDQHSINTRASSNKERPGEDQEKQSSGRKRKGERIWTVSGCSHLAWLLSLLAIICETPNKILMAPPTAEAAQ